MSPFFLITTHLILLAYALIGGVFLAFSDFIMRALSRTSGAGGVEAMQIINREVFHWIFMVLFLGLAPVSLGLAVFSAIFIGGSAGALMALAGLIYVIGCFGVTVCFNVPMNQALAGMDRAASETEVYWTSTYLPRWTFWNSVRAVACVVAAALLATAQVI